MNNIKTPGEVAYLAYGYSKWSDCAIQDQWHNVAAAVIAHHEAQKAQHWTLPAPPPGREWHRQDWREDMLPDEWRPLLLDEVIHTGDEFLQAGTWLMQDANNPRTSVGNTIPVYFLPHRTRRPLPPTNTCKVNLPPLTLTCGIMSIGGLVSVVVEKGPQP